MAQKKQVQPTDKKKGNCGCGCIDIPEKQAKETKPVAGKPKN